MRSEQRKRRAGRRLGAAAAVLVALALAAGCGTGAVPVGTGGVGAAPAPVDAAVRTTVGGSTGTDTGSRSTAAPATRLPADLVGSWSGDDPQGVGSWTFEFAADGHYAEYNTGRGVTFVGEAAVAGSRLYLQPQDADSLTVKWQVSGGRLSLDGTVYLRARSAQQDGSALVGSWIGETNTWQTVRFSDDGTWEFDDGPQGVSSGRYSVSGDRLATGRSTYTWSVDGTQLRLDLPGGQTATYSRIG